MIRSLKQIKNRIRSIENTKKVTHAMEMISVAKLNRIDDYLFAMRSYYSKLEEITNNFFAGSSDSSENIYLRERENKKNIYLCLITSDSGLCGVYNNGIIRLAEEFINKAGKEKISLVTVGKKGWNYFKKKGFTVANYYIGLNGRYQDKACDGISSFLINEYVSGKADEVYLAFTHHQTALVHKPLIKKFLNITGGNAQKEVFILEPDRQGIARELVPRYLTVSFRLAILEAFTSEHAARVVAMKSATDNAKELLEQLILQRNKVRQANITQEIMEIVSASEALRG